jgi:hypothetical protein
LGMWAKVPEVLLVKKEFQFEYPSYIDT